MLISLLKLDILTWELNIGIVHLKNIYAWQKIRESMINLLF